MLFLLLLIGSPAMAEGDYESFQEICEFTGEVKQRVNYESADNNFSVMETFQLEEN